MEADQLTPETATSEDSDAVVSDEIEEIQPPPLPLEVEGPARPLVAIIDEVLIHFSQQRMVEERKEMARRDLAILRQEVIDLGARVTQAEAMQATAEQAALAEQRRATYYQQLATAQDQRNETLVIGVVEAVTALEVAAARLRQVRARVGMEHVIRPPDLPP